MKIYFSCSITGGRDDQKIYAQIVDHLQHTGYEVLTAHLASEGMMTDEVAMDPFEVYERDMGWLQTCDALLAEVTTPSHGVGYEIAEALHHNKPVFCCYQKGRKVSKILTGNVSEGFLIRPYGNFSDLSIQIQAFLTEIGKAK